MSQPQTLNRIEATVQIQDLARRDPKFRAALQADPQRALKDAFGVSFAEGFEINVVQETPTRLWLVLPPDVGALDEGELSDEDLALVAGGMGVANIQACSSWDKCVV